MNDQEAVEGLRSVGVPVTAPHGGVLGALDISGPLYRLPPNDELARSWDGRELESELLTERSVAPVVTSEEQLCDADSVTTTCQIAVRPARLY